MDLETAKNSYITRSKMIIDANEMMTKDAYGLVEVVTRKKLKEHKEKVTKYYDWLREYDQAYSETLSIDGTIEELQLKQAKSAIVANARNLFISSLNNYESELSNIESGLNFRLTTSIAIIAIVVSMFGLA